MAQYKNLDQLFVSFSSKNENLEKNSDEIFKKNKIVLFGAGGLGLRTLIGLRKIGIEPACFIDSNPNNWGKKIEGLEILSPDESSKKFRDHVVVVTIWSDKIGHPLNEVEELFHIIDNEIEVVSFIALYKKYYDAFLPYFSIDDPQKTLLDENFIKDAFKLFSDEYSRNEFISQLDFRLYGNVDNFNIPLGSKFHFHNDLYELNETDIIVDIGAFDGDSLKDCLKFNKSTFEEYHAFEPDPVNFSKLTNFVESLPFDIKNKIKLNELGVSDKKKSLTFDASGSLQSSFNINGSLSINCVSIDEYFQGDVKPNFIKIDAEGAEDEIIIGAKNCIKSSSTIFAISVYHKYDHLWRLPLLFNNLNNEYDFYLRPLCSVGWDLICYCVPKNRNIKNRLSPI
jgi:FkbM family methyltransferase